MNKIESLQHLANKLRKTSIQITTEAGSGHPTTCMSMAEITSCLFFDEMKINTRNSKDLGNDEFILSKGHAAPILWAAYLELGIIRKAELKRFRQYGSRLEGHPTANMPWIKAATGSLGQGLAVGVGMAIANKIRKIPSRTYVVMGDGEAAEGSVWSAAELASKLKLNNLVAILDANRLAQSGESIHSHDVQAWKKKFAAFGWNSLVIDGHNIKLILNAFAKAKKSKKPFAIIAKTYKGKGVKFLQNKPNWHGKALNEEQMQKALKEIGEIPKINAKNIVAKPRNIKIKSLKKAKVTLPKYKLNEKVATRKAFGEALAKLGKDERYVAVDGDTKNSTFTFMFLKQWPKRFVECYIAEQNMAGVSLGLQTKEFWPFPTTFGTFFTRAHDQIRMAAISKANIKFVGTHVGVSIGMDGPSQMGLEDISMFRCIPKSVVLYPSDAVSTAKCVELVAKYNGISYLRTSRPATEVLYSNTEKFKIGGSKILKKGNKLVIITAGITVQESLRAAGSFGKKVSVIDCYSVKPIDKNTLLRETKGKKVLVIEDHYPEGGLGEAVGSLGISYEHIAVDHMPRSGSPKDLLKSYQLDESGIRRKLGRMLSR